MNTRLLLLDYASRYRIHRRRDVILAITVAILIIGFTLSGVRRCLGDYYKQAWYLVAQRRCEQLLLPANLVVYDDRLEPLPTSDAINGSYIRLASVADASMNTTSPPLPSSVDVNVKREAPMPVGYLPAALGDVGFGRPALFSHILRAKGTERIVIVTPSHLFSPHFRILYLGAEVLVPASIAPGSRMRNVENRGYRLPLRIPYESRLRIFAGQPDMSDPAHLTLNYAVDGENGIIDGWLLNENELKLQVRTGPLREN
jgi:hypothetical protein